VVVFRRLTLVAALVALTAGLVVLPAAAHHGPPYSEGPDHTFGEMVEYPLVFPVQGAYSWRHDGFEDWRCCDPGEIHHGQDIMAERGTPVVAAADATVVWVGTNCCSLFLRHDDGWETWYIHLDNDTPGTDDGLGWGIAEGIERGSRVQAGQLIGWVGDSGSAEETPPHLHFELLDPHDTIVNPYASLRAAEQRALLTCDGYPATILDEDGDGTIEGTDGDDVIVGGMGPDLIIGLGGNDVICGRGGDDVIDGGPGDDRIWGGSGEDQIDGGSGVNTIVADDEAAPEEAERPALTTTEVLGPGDRGEAVADLQALLAELGYQPGPADGIYGDRTLRAVRAFQADAGIESDGLVGPGTRAALREALTGGLVGGLADTGTGTTEGSAEPLGPGSVGDDVRVLQESLIAAGYDPGVPDGIYGSLTTAAVAAFQGDHGLEVDGIADMVTISAITEAATGGSAPPSAEPPPPEPPSTDDGTPPPDPATLAVLRLGSKGDDVALAQVLLTEAGFDAGPADGMFGPMTDSAARAFQAYAGLGVDGVIGRLTWTALLGP
jgi:peptidoglycan hydrolase-like protein with peptidoglycan-binding domain/murein DD-endopeptidase MepM/ murein hydrolase activator NlpD